MSEPDKQSETTDKPAHRMFAIPELVRTILHYATMEGCSKEKALLIALLCKDFEHALDMIWYEQTNLIPLIRTLPMNVWAIKTQKRKLPRSSALFYEHEFVLAQQLTLGDTARFRFYAKRVKHFVLTQSLLLHGTMNDQEELQHRYRYPQDVLQQICNLYGGRSLFPTLRCLDATVHFRDTDHSIYWAMFPAASLRRVIVRYVNDCDSNRIGNADMVNYQQLIETLIASCHNIQILETSFDIKSKPADDCLLWLDYLKHRHQAKARPLESLRLHSIISENLVLQIGKICKTKHLDVTFPPAQLAEPAWKDSTSLFPALQALDLRMCDSLLPILDLLRALDDSRLLRRVVVNFFERDPPSLQFVEDLSALLSPQSLEHLHIEEHMQADWTNRPVGVPLDVISPLLKFTSLRCLAIHIPVNVQFLNDDLLAQIGRTLSNLVAFDIGCYNLHTKVTWHGVLQFLRIRPVRLFGVRFDIDVLDSWDLPVIPKLECLIPHGTILTDVLAMTRAVEHHFPLLAHLLIDKEDEPGWYNIGEHLRGQDNEEFIRPRVLDVLNPLLRQYADSS